MTRPLTLTLMLGGVGSQYRAWRRPGSRIEELHTLGLFADIAARAEAARFDALFVADVLALDPPAVVAPQFNPLEPITLFAALAARTTTIGLIPTVSTTFSEPYNVARQIASLDHLSGGRAAWNAVTSFVGEANFGLRALPDPVARYARADEFVATVIALWNSWDDDAIVRDRARGVFAEPAKVHRIDHVGPHFRVQGPLNVARSVQGRPVLVQAGSSAEGRDLAAKYAELVYTAQPTAAESQRFYADLKARVAAYGRDPAHVTILTGVSPILAPTEAQARALADELREPTDLDVGRARVSRQLGGVDLSGLDLDRPLPPELLPDVRSVGRRQGRFEIFKRLALTEGTTLRRLIEVELNSSGHWVVVGTPEQVADLLAERHAQGGTDGFNISPAYLPEGLDLVVDGLVPELRRRGLARADYAGPTLRDQLGLPRPTTTTPEPVRIP